MPSIRSIRLSALALVLVLLGFQLVRSRGGPELEQRARQQVAGLGALFAEQAMDLRPGASVYVLLDEGADGVTRENFDTAFARFQEVLEERAGKLAGYRRWKDPLHEGPVYVEASILAEIIREHPTLDLLVLIAAPPDPGWRRQLRSKAGVLCLAEGPYPFRRMLNTGAVDRFIIRRLPPDMQAPLWQDRFYEIRGGRLKRRGFSLIELLVVIAIIVLLIALLLPALGQLKERGNRVVCLAQQRQIGMALRSYATTHDGRLPPHQAWHDSLGLGVYAVRGRSASWKTRPEEEKFRGNGALVHLKFIPAELLYCPSWRYPFVQLGQENDGGYRGGPIWPLAELPGHQLWMQTSYAFRGAAGYLDGSEPRSPSLKFDPGNFPIVADHFSDPRRGVQWHHYEGYNTLYLDGSAQWIWDREQAVYYYNGGFTYHAGAANYRKQEQVWDRYFTRRPSAAP